MVMKAVPIAPATTPRGGAERRHPRLFVVVSASIYQHATVSNPFDPKRQRPAAAIDDPEPVSVCQSGLMQLVEPAGEHQAWPPPS